MANFTCLTFERAHRVAAEPLRISIKTPFDLQDNLLFFVGHQQPGDRQMALTGYGQWRDRRQVGRRRGSGFLMFYATDPGRLRQAMADAGMDEVPFRFEFEGTKIILS